MTPPFLLVAHPGHELLLQGWISLTKPAVHVLTDGSGHTAEPRLDRTAELLRELGAKPGAIFGRLTDREAYALITERNSALLVSLIAELASAIEQQRPSLVVTDAVEGYNPVHDLCCLIAGAAIELSSSNAKHYAYAVVGDPRQGELVIELDDAAYAAKLERARRYAPILPDAAELLARHGSDAYRYETLCAVTDWRRLGADERPLYERFGEERVAAHRYDHVIRRDEHLVPLRDAVCNTLDRRSCAF
ncbi:MAG TPA: hypothetical protein VII75_15315 [Thermoanaerobaculia bacterium]|nr:hypothetical protein [Thermoanaerobaculia bacterium]